MVIAGRPLGCLSAFCRSAEPLADTSLQALQALATVAATVLATAEQASARALAEQLQRALDSRVVIEQAKGIIAERENVGLDEAFDLVRRYARRHNGRLQVVAGRVVQGDLAELT